VNDMTGSDDPDDVLALLSLFTPTDSLVETEWTPARRRDTLTAIIGDHDRAATNPRVHDLPLRFLPAGAAAPALGRRRPRLLPVASGAAILAVTAAALAVVLNSTGSSDSGSPAGSGGPLGPVFDPPGGLSHSAIGATQYSHRIDQQISLRADGRPTGKGSDDMINRNWISADGSVVSVRTGSQNGCTIFPAPTDNPGIDQPTRNFLATLPTDADALTTYLRSHVHGSSSRDSAVFVSVGDTLRAMDAFASPALRGALVGVLSRTPGVTVHQGQRDYLGRPAIRADFVDQRIEPGSIRSLYFDPTNFRLVEERDGRSGQPAAYTGPSPAYGADPTERAGSPEQLSGAAFIDIVTTEQTVDALPTLPADCKQSGSGG
jgi:hypothetical protein